MVKVYKDGEVYSDGKTPVPSYDKVKELETRVFISKKKEEVAEMVVESLEKQLEIATNALKNIKVYSQRDWDEYNCMECADKALKEMEGLK